MRKKFLILWAALALFVATPAITWAQDYDSNNTEVVEGDYGEEGEYMGPDDDFEAEYNDASTTSDTTTNTGGMSSRMKGIAAILLGVLIFLGILWMIGHMLYEIFIRKNPFQPLKQEDMLAARAAAGRPAEETEEEKNQVLDLLETERLSWTPLYDEDDSRVITKKSMIDSSAATIEKIKEIAPTDQETIDVVNSFIDIMKTSRKREFDGSKLLVTLLVIFCILMVWGMGWKSIPFFVFGGVAYILSCMKPTFMLYDRDIKGKTGRGALNWLLGGVFGMIAGAQTIRTTTHWSDGSTTTDDDHTQHFIAWAIGIIVIVIMLSLMLVWAAVNYLRNYVFYR